MDDFTRCFKKDMERFIEKKIPLTPSLLKCYLSLGWVICQWTVCTLFNNLFLTLFFKKYDPNKYPRKKSAIAQRVTLAIGRSCEWERGKVQRPYLHLERTPGEDCFPREIRSTSLTTKITTLNFTENSKKKFQLFLNRESYIILYVEIFSAININN